MTKKKKIIIFSVLLVLVLVFRLCYSIYIFNYKYDEWKNIKKEITIFNVDKIEEESIRYIGFIDGDKVIFSVKDVDNIYSFGDKISVICSYYKISYQGNPHEFNYKIYLNSNGIILRLNITKVLNVDVRDNIISRIRKSISDALDKDLGKYSQIIKSLMYGDDTFLDENFKDKCKSIGIGHMMCVSGTHVMFLVLVLEKISDSKGKILNILNLWIILYFYTVSLFKISLLRVVVMYVLNLLFPKIKHELKLGICVYIVLIINPYYIFNIGILLSFLSVISIRVFNPVISSFLSVKMHIKSKYILSNMAMSISSLVLILPFQIYYFGVLSPICILSNIGISFVLSFLMQFIFYSYIFILVPYFATVILKVVYLLTHVFVFEVNILAKINVFNISLPRINIVIFILYCLSLIIVIYKSRIAIVYLWKYRKIAKCVMDGVIVFSIIYILFWYVHTMYFESYVIYFNVGQGNMCLIHRGKTNIVIDCGSTQDGNASYILSSFLKAKNIDTIDLLLITHMHSDHMNGVEDVISSGIKVLRVGYTKPYTRVYECEKLYSILKNENIGIIYLEQEDEIVISKIKIKALTPPKEYYFSDTDMLNANSTVYLVEGIGKRMLFMGDSTKVTEAYLEKNYLDIIGDIDYYQVSHHGSKTSSLKSFLSNIKIKNAIISSKEAIYGHPDKEVLDILNDLNINIYITEKTGAIIF